MGWGKRGNTLKEAERIKFETEMLKLTAALATITGGGSISRVHIRILAKENGMG